MKKSLLMVLVLVLLLTAARPLAGSLNGWSVMGQVKVMRNQIGHNYGKYAAFGYGADMFCLYNLMESYCPPSLLVNPSFEQ